MKDDTSALLITIIYFCVTFVVTIESCQIHLSSDGISVDLKWLQYFLVPTVVGHPLILTT